MRAPVSQGIALKTFLAAAENMALCQLHRSKDIVVRLQDKGSRFVIPDKNDYIDQVESNFSDSLFDILSSDPSHSFYRTVKDRGNKWMGIGEITQPLLNCILNVNPRPGKN